MSLSSDLKTLYRIVWKRAKGPNHAARMEDFFGRQAADYDDFRERMLRGRQELCDRLPAPENGVWVELGCGTGRNLEFLGERIHKLRKVYLVDLSPSMLEIAKQRIARRGWTNVETVEADATLFRPPEGSADVIAFSYSLTMIPHWFAALDHARSLLKPGGTIGVVDFYVSQKYPPPDFARHSLFTRTFWPFVFHIGNVFNSPDHLPYLERRFERIHLCESRLKIPYVPLLRVPYYFFVGKKPGE
ncbi:MAG: class I SAM-dependent methyltransferase [Pirellulales bacterium]|nr:class I SAM-dependent methyltransferase [Pirellulales bacterium]